MKVTTEETQGCPIENIQPGAGFRIGNRYYVRVNLGRHPDTYGIHIDMPDKIFAIDAQAYPDVQAFDCKTIVFPAKFTVEVRKDFCKSRWS